MASRRGFLRLSRVLPTSRVFTSGYVNTETILHFFNSGSYVCCRRHLMTLMGEIASSLAEVFIFTDISALKRLR